MVLTNQYEDCGGRKKTITGIKNTIEFHESLGGKKGHFLIVRRTKLALVDIFLLKPSQNLNIHSYLATQGLISSEII